MTTRRNQIKSFRLRPGQRLAGKYRIVDKLGAGWEGEVYKIHELNTGVERAAKLFFPQRNVRNRVAKFYAKKLHKLRECPILIQYHTEERLHFGGIEVTALISEYVEGILLNEFIKGFPGKRLTPYQGLHLLYALIKGLEQIHLMNEYHGDLHTQNVIVNHFGLNFKLKLVDFYHWPESAGRECRQDDVCSAIRIFYDCIGGSRWYARQPQTVKDICCGLKTSLILKKFRNASQLRKYLEVLEWSDY